MRSLSRARSSADKYSMRQFKLTHIIERRTYKSVLTIQSQFHREYILSFKVLQSNQSPRNVLETCPHELLLQVDLCNLIILTLLTLPHDNSPSPRSPVIPLPSSYPHQHKILLDRVPRL